MRKTYKKSFIVAYVLILLTMLTLFTGCSSDTPQKYEYCDLWAVMVEYTDLSDYENDLLENKFKTNFESVTIENNKVTIAFKMHSITFDISENDGSIFSKTDYKYAGNYNGFNVGIDYTDEYVKYFASYPYPYRCEAFYAKKEYDN